MQSTALRAAMGKWTPSQQDPIEGAKVVLHCVKHKLQGNSKSQVWLGGEWWMSSTDIAAHANHSVSYNFMQLKIQGTATSSWPILYFHWRPSLALSLPSLLLPTHTWPETWMLTLLSFLFCAIAQCESAHAIQHSGCFYKQLFFCTSPLKWH